VKALVRILLLLLCTQSVVLGAPFDTRPPEIHSITFNTWPPDARIFLEASQRQYLGRSGQPIPMNSAQFRDNEGKYQTAFRLTFELPGYEPAYESIPTTIFQSSEPVYPQSDDRRKYLRLTPEFPVVVDLYYMAVLHPVPAALIAVAVIFLTVTTLRRRREQKALIDRANRIEKLKAHNTSDPFIGSELGGYRITDRLGAGGMATVYRALPDDTLDEKDAVALKVISRDMTADPEFVRRFNHEVRACNKLRHKSIVCLYASGEQEGILFMAMEIVKGVTLRDRMRNGQISLDNARAILSKLLQGVDYAHAQGIVHRDLKPDNVMITDDDTVKIMDFGLARSRDFSKVTKTGTTMGTPAYMPPEQITSQPVDARADQYALGILAYEMLCGTNPFEEEDPMATIYKHLTVDAPPPSTLRPDLPKAVDAVILKMLAKAPADRYPRLDQALKALDDALN